MPVAAYQNCLKLEQTNILRHPRRPKHLGHVREFVETTVTHPTFKPFEIISNRDDDVINRLELLVGVHPFIVATSKHTPKTSQNNAMCWV